MVLADGWSEQAIVDAVRAGRTVVKIRGPEDPMVELVLRSGEQRAELGDTLTGVGSVDVEVTVGAGGDGAVVELWKDGVQVATAPVAQPVTRFERPVSGTLERYRVELTRDGQRITVTSHAYVDGDPTLAPETGCGCRGGSGPGTAAGVRAACGSWPPACVDAARLTAERYSPPAMAAEKKPRKPAAKKPAGEKKPRASKKPKAAPGSAGISAADSVGGAPSPEITALEARVARRRRQGGGPLPRAARRPLGAARGRCRIDQVEPTPYQRELSKAHADRLAVVIPKVGRFLDPIVAVPTPEGFRSPNGMHRLSAMRALGAQAITALIVPEPEVAFRILALNTEKAHNLRDKSLEVVRMVRALAADPARGKRPEIGATSSSSSSRRSSRIGICYEQNGRFSGGAYLPVVNKLRGVERPAAARHRWPSARPTPAKLLELDEAVNAAVAKLKEAGFKSGYLKPVVVARINPLRFVKVKPGQPIRADFDKTIDKMLEARAGLRCLEGQGRRHRGRRLDGRHPGRVTLRSRSCRPTMAARRWARRGLLSASCSSRRCLRLGSSMLTSSRAKRVIPDHSSPVGSRRHRLDTSGLATMTAEVTAGFVPQSNRAIQARGWVSGVRSGATIARRRALHRHISGASGWRRACRETSR